MNSINSSWPCAGGFKNNCIKDQWWQLNSTQNLINILSSENSILPDNFWNISIDQFNQIRNLWNDMESVKDDKSFSIEVLNVEWFDLVSEKLNTLST